MRTQEEINYYFQSFAIKSATELVKIEGILEVHGIQLPNNIIIHKNGIAVAKFLNWWQNKSNYPKTIEECVKLLGVDFKLDMDSYKRKLMANFYRLILCRDAYWKIAGEKMELGKSWEPNWTTFEGMPAIFRFRYNIVCDSIKNQHCLLVFPTEEMRDAFYENFKDLIGQCKELL